MSAIYVERVFEREIGGGDQVANPLRLFDHVTSFAAFSFFFFNRC